MGKDFYPKWYVKCFDAALDIWYPLAYEMQDSRMKIFIPFLDLLMRFYEGFLILIWQRRLVFKYLLKEWYFHSLLDFWKV